MYCGKPCTRETAKKNFFPQKAKKKNLAIFWHIEHFQVFGYCISNSAQSSRFQTMNITDIAMREKNKYILRGRHGGWTSRAKEAALSVCRVGLVAPRGGWVNGQQVGRLSRCGRSAGNQEPPRLAGRFLRRLRGSVWTGPSVLDLCPWPLCSLDGKRRVFFCNHGFPAVPLREAEHLFVFSYAVIFILRVESSSWPQVEGVCLRKFHAFIFPI